MFEYYNHLGSFNPFVIKHQNGFDIKESFSEIVENYEGTPDLDPMAAVSVINKGFIIGNRTTIKGIEKAPWLAKPNIDNTDWEYHKLPQFNNDKASEEEIAEKLFNKVIEEIEFYVNGRKKIGVLLSGGMDSRIAAGALDYLIKEKNLEDLEVTALTWGNDDSRDVIYAKIIADRLGWEWKHYPITAEILKANITESAANGTEYSPIHLHSMVNVREDNLELDCIIAGSYGDSIGRAEYSGVKVPNLRELTWGIKNISGIFKPGVAEDAFEVLSEDVRILDKPFPARYDFQRREFNYQQHYMFRMLNPCLAVIDKKVPVFQVFTKPSVFEYMWSVDPSLRDDFIYKRAMELFKTQLNDIPWARTGLPYLQKEGTPDNYKRKYSSYNEFLNGDLYSLVKELLFNGTLDEFGIFNMAAVKELFKLQTTKTINNHFYSERLLWIASLSMMAEMYNLKPQNKVKHTILDTLRAKTKTALEFNLRYYKNKK